MARQKTTTTVDENALDEGQVIKEQATDQEKPVPEQKVKAQKAPESPMIQEILKSYPAYKSLFIDAHGGTYTPDTSEAIRGKSTLYENPFYKS